MQHFFEKVIFIQTWLKLMKFMDWINEPVIKIVSGVVQSAVAQQCIQD